jgi:hypothetical protein
MIISQAPKEIYQPVFLVDILSYKAT